MKVGIVGSRKRDCEAAVRRLVKSLPKGSIVISGGAVGVDTWAEDEALRLGLEVRIFRPVKKGPGYGFACRALTERNKLIAQECDVLYAFPSDKKGGTDQTIRFAKVLGKRVEIW